MVRDLGCRFVLVDPIVASIDLGLDAHKDQHVRSVLRKLVAKFDGDEVRLLDRGCRRDEPHVGRATSRGAI